MAVRPPLPRLRRAPACAKALPAGAQAKAGGAPAGNRNRLCRLRGGCIASMLQGRTLADAMRHANGQTDGAPAAHPGKRGRWHESAVQFWTFTMSNSKILEVPPTRARRAHARIVNSFDARGRECGRTPSIHLGYLAFGCRYGPIGSLLPVGGGWWPAAGLFRLS